MAAKNAGAAPLAVVSAPDPATLPTALQMEGPVPMMTSSSSGYTAANRLAQRKRVQALVDIGTPRVVKGSHRGRADSWVVVFGRVEADDDNPADYIAPAVLMSGESALLSAEIPDSAVVADGAALVDDVRICWLQLAPGGKRWGLMVGG